MSEEQKCTGPFSDARDCPVHGLRPHPLSLLRVNAGEEIRLLNDQLAAARAETESLKHDLSRHLSITSEQATEILGKEKRIAEAAMALEGILTVCAVADLRTDLSPQVWRALTNAGGAFSNASAVLSELQLKGK